MTPVAAGVEAGSVAAVQSSLTVLLKLTLAFTGPGAVGGVVSLPAIWTFSKAAGQPAVGPAIALAPVSWLVPSTGVPAASATVQAALVSAVSAVSMSAAVRPL